MISTKVLGSVVTAATAVLMCASNAHANSILQSISGTSTVPMTGSGGVATLSSVNLNGWTVSFAEGTTYPATGSQAAPLDDLASVNVSTTGHAPLYIEFDSTGFTTALPATATAIMSGAALSGSLAGSYKTYYSSNDVLLGLSSLLTSQTFNAGNLNGTATGTVYGSGEFSLSQVIEITAGNGSLDDSVKVSTPDGGMTVMMLGGALTALGLIRSRTSKL